MTPLPQARASFFARQNELALVAAALSQPQPRALTLSGPPGVGKSALLAAALQRQAAAGALTGTAKHIGPDEAGEPFIGALESAVEAGLRSLYDPESGLAGLGQLLGAGAAVLAPYGRGPFRRLARASQPKPLNVADAEARFDALVVRVLRWLEGFKQPIVLALDDWGRAAPQTARLYRRLVADPSLESLRLIASERPDEALGDLSARRITLAPFDDDELGDFVARLLDVDLERVQSLASVLGQTGARTPLMVIERLRRLESAGCLETRGAELRLDSARAHALLLAEAKQSPLDQPRLDTPAIGRIACSLALLETEADHAELREGAGLPPKACDDALATLLASGVVMQKEGRLSFSHDSFREAALKRLDETQRVRLAADLAEMLRRGGCDPASPARGALMLRLCLAGGLAQVEPALWEHAFLHGAMAARRRGERHAAHQFSAIAMRLAQQRGRVRHEVALEATLAAIEQGHFESAFAAIVALQSQAQSELEEAEADELLVYAKRMSGDLDGALVAAREGLRRMGVVSPKSAFSLNTVLALVRVLITDPDWAARQSALTSAELEAEAPMMRAVHALGSLLFERSPLFAAGFLARSISPRLAAGSAAGAAAYAVISGNLGLHRRGGQWATLSDQRQSPVQPLRAAAMLYATNMGPRTLTPRAALKDRRIDLINTALDDGDLSVALYAMRDRLQDALLTTSSLRDAVALANDALELSDRLQDPGIRVAIAALRQTIANLAGTGSVALSGAFFDSAATQNSAALAPAANTRRTVATLEALLAASFGDYARLALLYERHHPSFRGVHRNEQSRIFVFTSALGLLRVGRAPPRPYLAAIAHAARINPANYRHRWLLITAEQKRRRAPEQTTLHLYEEAAAAASQSWLELGIICRAGAEAAQFMGDPAAAAQFRQRANDAWSRLGATALVAASNAKLHPDAATQEGLIDARAAHAAAEQANLARSRLLAAVSHELRTPLQGLKGLVELGELDGPENHAALKGAVAQLSSSIEELMALAAAESASPQNQPAAIALAPLLQEITTLARPSLDAGRRFIVTVPREATRRFLIDVARVRQILTNLTANAVKYGKGDITLSAEVGPADNGVAIVRFQVDDEGPALPDEEWAQLFEPFMRGGHAQSKDGLGLGLAISRRLALALGGELTAGATSTGATRFSLVLRLRSVADLGVRPTAIPPGLKVLLAEDEPLSRRVIAALLERDGARVTSVADGAAALVAAARERFDVMLLDARMPGLSGIETADQLRRAGNLTRIVLLSAALDDAIKARAQILGASTLQKPVGRAELAAVLASCGVASPEHTAMDARAYAPAEEVSDDMPVSRQEACAGALTLIEAIAAAAITADSAALARLAHKLHGLSAQFGLTALARFTAETELAPFTFESADVAGLRAAYASDLAHTEPH